MMGRLSAIWKAILDAATVKVWAQIGAAVALTFVLTAGGWVVWRGGWEVARQEQQLDALFYLLVGVEVLILVALAAITGLSVNLRGGKDGITASIDQDEAQPITVATTTTTTVTPAAAEVVPDDGELPPDQRVKL